MSAVTFFLLVSTAVLGVAHAALWLIENGNKTANPGAGAVLNIPSAGLSQASGSAGLRAPGKGKVPKSERVRILEAYLKTI